MSYAVGYLNKLTPILPLLQVQLACSSAYTYITLIEISFVCLSYHMQIHSHTENTIIGETETAYVIYSVTY